MCIIPTSTHVRLAACFLLPLLPLFILACSPSGASAPLTPAQFTREAGAALRAHAPADVKVRIAHDLMIDVSSKDTPAGFCDLSRAYAEYQKDPSQKADIIQHWTAAQIGLLAPPSTAVDTTRILPVVRNRSYLQNTANALRSQGIQANPDFLYDDLNDDLIILYAQSTHNTLHFLHAGDLANLKIDRKNLRSLACANLSRQMPKIIAAGGKGITMLATDNGFAPALLLFDSFWDKRKLNVKGDIVVGIPDDDTLIVTGSEDPECLTIARKTLTETYAKATKPISEKLYILQAGKLRPFKDSNTQPAQSQ